MARGQKGIFVTDAEFKVLAHSKNVLQRVTNTDLSWGAYLALLASGSLAIYALRGLELSCPSCGDRSMVRYVGSMPEQEADFEAPDPFSSREPTSPDKQPPHRA